MEVNIRQETEKDYPFIEKTVEEAFKEEEFSDHKEHLLVAKLRKSDAFVPELSLVAEIDGIIAGHILLTKILIEEDKRYPSLALAPVSVLPAFQKQGVGSRLILEALARAKNLGYTSVIVLGHAHYYPRFGFQPAATWGITAPFEVPEEAFMALELEPGSLSGVRGTVVYSRAFFE